MNQVSCLYVKVEAGQKGQLRLLLLKQLLQCRKTGHGLCSLHQLYEHCIRFNRHDLSFFGCSPQSVEVCVCTICSGHQHTQALLMVCCCKFKATLSDILSLVGWFRKGSTTYPSTQPCSLRWETRPPQCHQRRHPRDLFPTASQGTTGEKMIATQ